MKKALAIFVCLCLLTQCIARLGVIGWYEVNKDYIAKNLCENRDKPAMKCCGKCYLRKQLKKVDDENDTSKKQSNKVEKNDVLVYVLPGIAIPSCTFVATHKPVQHATSQHLFDNRFLPGIFHPPSLAA